MGSSSSLNETNNSNKLIFFPRKTTGAAALPMQIGSEPIANKGGEDGGCVGCGIVSQSAVVCMEPSQAGWFLFVWFFSFNDEARNSLDPRWSGTRLVSDTQRSATVVNMTS